MAGVMSASLLPMESAALRRGKGGCGAGGRAAGQPQVLAAGRRSGHDL